jgi:hypothetical protein
MLGTLSVCEDDVFSSHLRLQEETSQHEAQSDAIVFSIHFLPKVVGWKHGPWPRECRLVLKAPDGPLGVTQ